MSLSLCLFSSLNAEQLGTTLAWNGTPTNDSVVVVVIVVFLSMIGIGRIYVNMTLLVVL